MSKKDKEKQRDSKERRCINMYKYLWTKYEFKMKKVQKAHKLMIIEDGIR